MVLFHMFLHGWYAISFVVIIRPLQHFVQKAKILGPIVSLYMTNNVVHNFILFQINKLIIVHIEEHLGVQNPFVKFPKTLLLPLITPPTLQGESIVKCTTKSTH